MWFWLKQPLVGEGARCDGCKGDYMVINACLEVKRLQAQG